MEEAFVAQLNSLAERIPLKAFSVADERLDCVTYVVVFRGPLPVEYERGGRRWRIENGTAVYVGEGKRGRATAQFKGRGKIVGHVGKAFDDFIATHWPHFESYLAAANITKSVALEFERVLIEAFDPPFNAGPPRSNWWGLPQGQVDHRADMHSAQPLAFRFSTKPPPHTHQSKWDERQTVIDGRKFWDEIPSEWIITRRSPRIKANRADTRPDELVHFASYHRVGESTTVAEHRAKNEAANMSWQRIKEILHYDSTYIDSEGPIITITPPPAPS